MVSAMFKATGFQAEKEASQMIYKGVVKGNVVQLEDEVTLPEACVSVSFLRSRPQVGF